MKKIVYIYHPLENQLYVSINGKIKGGFVGDIAIRKLFELLGTDAEISIGDMPMTKKEKIRKLRALWIQQGCDQYREAILEPYGVTSTADLTEEQLDHLIRMFTIKKDVPPEIRQARSMVLKLLTQIGIYDNTGDWTSVNQYLMDKRIAGKLLYQMDLQELHQLSVKLRSILKKQIEKSIELQRLTFLN